MWLAVSGFMVMGLVSGVSLASHSDSGPFLVLHPLLSQDGRQQGGFWEVGGYVASPFDLSQTLLIFDFPCENFINSLVHSLVLPEGTMWVVP